MGLENVFTLNVDIKETNYAYDRKITANDNTTFVINLTSDGLPMDLSNVTLVTLANTRLDRQTVVTPGEITGTNQVTFEIGQNETKKPGRVTAVVQLYDAEGRVSMLAFNYTVVADPTGDGYIPAGTDKTLIQVVLGDGPLVIAQVQGALDNANLALDIAEQAKVAADEATANSNTATAEAQTATNNALSATASADEAISRTNLATSNANTAASNANTAADNANSAASNANSAATSARNAADSVGNVTAGINTAIANAETATTNANNAATSINNDMKIVHKGTVATYAGLPTSGRVVGDTWVVTSDPDASKNGQYRWQSNNTWLRINTQNLTGAESVANVGVVAKAQADIVRQSVHSGILNPILRWVENFRDGAKDENRVFPPQYQSASSRNAFQISSMNSIINGYNTYISANANVSGLANIINLPEPPLHGTRDDLVFLEAWFPQNGNGYELSWRIRTVAGVDFAKFPEGLGYYFTTTPTTYETATAPQGGNTEPISIDKYTTSSSHVTLNYFYSQERRSATGSSSKKIAVDDVGLYVAGDGSQQSKDLLKTLDGYVYAIPLFRVNRRNSGGYRADNLNGAREYLQPTFLTRSQTIGNPDVTTNNVAQWTLNRDVDYDQVSVGDIFAWTANPNLYKVRVESKDGNKTLTVRAIGTGGTVTGYGNTPTSDFYRLSDRPDNLYSNIIDASDIIDLRHQVSLTGVDKPYILSQATESVMQGKSNLRETAKEVFNLKPAPLGLKQELVGVDVLGTDGVTRNLVNLLGTDGDCEKTDWTSVTTSHVLDSSNKTTGKNGIKITTSGAVAGYIYKDLFGKIKSGKYYIFLADLKNGNASNGIRLRQYNVGGVDKYSTYITDSSKFIASYVKIAPTDFNGATSIRMGIYVNGADTQYGYVDSVRVYEIDQETYDKIDVLPEFTGEELAKKFPYVDSYPNFVENLFDKTKVENDKVINIANGNADTSSGGYTVSEFTSVITGSSYSLSGLTKRSTAKAFYDSNKSFLSGTTVDSFTAPSNAIYVRFSVHKDDLETAQLEKGSTANPYVPQGRYYLPYDYASGQTKHYLAETLNEQRSIMSDAQTSETRVDIVEALKTPQKHIKVTQATEGEWKVGDKIAVKADYPISGVIDADTALAVVTETTGINTERIVSDVSKLTVGDIIVLYNESKGTSGITTIQSIDTATKKITFSSNQSSGDFGSGSMLIETTTSTSSPLVTATGIAGTWSGLGTKEATYTITTAPTDDKTDILLQYAVNYPAGKGLQYLPSDILEGEVNGQKLVKTTGNVVIKDNFMGKVAGSNDANPHISKYQASNSLVTPSGTWYGETTQLDYGTISTLDGSSKAYTNSVNGNMMQQLFSFNLIEMVERKFGEGVFSDCADLAMKVAKAKGTAPFAQPLFVQATFNWWGRGSSVGGDKATISRWHTTNSNWTTLTSASHTNTGVSKLTLATNTSLPAMIDPNGFVHFLAYAEPSDGTTASTICTDYVDIELELNVAETGYTVLAPVDQMSVLSYSPSQFKVGDQILPPITDSRWTLHANAKMIEPYQFELNATDGTQWTDVRIEVKKNTNYTINLDHNGTYGVSSNNDGYVLAFGSTSPRTFNTKNSDYITVKMGNSSVQGVGKFNFSNLMLTLGSEPKPFKPYNKTYNKKKILNYLGKVAGSTVENPHRFLRTYGNSFLAPSSFKTEYNTNGYANISKQDGVLEAYIPTSEDGKYAQYLYEFDLSHLGLSLSELKKALRKLTVSWTGYGSGAKDGVKTFGATVKIWRNDNNTWFDFDGATNSTTSPSTITKSVSTNIYPTNTKKVYILVHGTYPSDGTIPSEIFTDYIKLEVELADYVDLVKTNILLVDPTTKTVKTKYPTVSHKFVGNGNGQDVISLHYRHIPKQKIANVGTPDREWTVPQFFQQHTVGTGKTTSEINRWIYELLDNASGYNGESLHSFMTKGSKQLPFEDVLMATKPETTANYIVLTSKIIEKSGQLYLRVVYKESKNLGTHVDLSSGVQTADFMLSGRPLVKNN